tara:strand:+ start:90 stop:497 length:408 start_codon:yes stop_codon:yes gene_type:complete
MKVRDTKTKQTFPTSDYKIASWSITNNDGDNSFLSKTHLTRDGVKTCCGTKLDDKVGGCTVIAATAKDIVNGKAQYLQAGEWHPFETYPNGSADMSWLLNDLRDAECCSKCEAATGNWVSFTVDAVLALSDSPTK